VFSLPASNKDSSLREFPILTPPFQIFSQSLSIPSLVGGFLRTLRRWDFSGASRSPPIVLFPSLPRSPYTPPNRSCFPVCNRRCNVDAESSARHGSPFLINEHFCLIGLFLRLSSSMLGPLLLSSRSLVSTREGCPPPALSFVVLPEIFECPFPR